MNNSIQVKSAAERAERERRAYDEDGVWDEAHKWHMRFEHVFHTPNTVQVDREFEEGYSRAGAGKRCLEIGCSSGVTASKLIADGAGYVFGVDISEKFLAEAKAKEIAGKMEFAVADIQKPLEGKFDVIFGRGILHHVDYKSVLTRLYRDNLNPGGSMHFVEPLGGNPLLRLYYIVAPKAHTPDERPFFRSDLRWLKANFPGFRIVPINFLSLPLGILSSFLFRKPDNALTRFGDRADRWISEKIPFLVPDFRAAVFIFRKGGSP